MSIRFLAPCLMPGLRDRRRDHDCARGFSSVLYRTVSNCVELCRTVSNCVELWADSCNSQRRYKHWRGKSKFYCAGRCITGGEVCC